MSFWSSFKAVAKREIERIKARRPIWIIMFVVPLVMSLMICETFKAGTPSNLPISVLDSDNSKASRQLVRMIEATPTCNIAHRVENLEDGKNQIIKGDSYALIVIPKNFQRDLYRQKRPQLVFYYNNQMILIGGSISKDVTTAVQTFMAGIDVGVRMKKGLAKDIAMKQINLVSVDDHVRSNPYLNYSYFLALTSFGHIIQILVIFLSIWAFGTEFKYGTTKEWFELSGRSISVAVLAKLAPYFIGFFAEMLLIYGIYFGYYGAPFVGSVGFVVLSMIIFILAYQFLGLMYVAITCNLRLSLSCGSFFTAMGFAFAGVTFPIIGMPAFARFFSWLMPLSHYMAIIQDQVLRGIPVQYDFHFVWEMVFLGCVGLAFVPRLRAVIEDEKMWYLR